MPRANGFINLVDLTSYVGRTVTIAFHMMASAVIERSGWYVDDVQVMGKVNKGNMAPILFLLNQE